jgi:CheY-like chemotaxis protein
MAGVLIVDDEPSVRDVVARGLRRSGADCEMADSGRGALVKLCERTAAGDVFDAIILDIVMPDIDGWSVLRAIRSNPLWRDLRVIVISGRANSAEDMVRAVEQDAVLVEKRADFPGVVADLLTRFAGASELTPALV